jgi:hypothetical protein
MSVGEEGVNFLYSKDITIDHNKVAADLTRFPVLIDSGMGQGGFVIHS